MRLIVSTMKDEGPFILEWIAHYLALGFDHFIINSNDCSDGTDLILQRLQDLGIVTHIDNPGPWTGGPQRAAYDNAMAHPRYAAADWVLVCDADEFLDIKVGDGTLDALFAVAPNTDVFTFVWRLFGHSGIVKFEDRFITEQMTMAAAATQIWPPQVRAIKSLTRMNGKYREILTHRPKKLQLQHKNQVYWTDGDGLPMYGFEHQGWMFNHAGVGYGDSVARMNHYAVRSIESYLVKRHRGDVNTTTFHDKMEQTGQHYWRLHCWNVVEEKSILRHNDRHKEHFQKLIQDNDLRDMHAAAVHHHKTRIDAINQTENAKEFTKLYANYRHAKVCLLSHEVISDPRLTINQNNFNSATFLQVMQMGRIDDMRVRLGARRYPWFTNIDALETGFDRKAATEIVEKHRADPTRYDMLPPLPQDLLDAVAAPAPQPTPREIKVSRARNRFLASVSNEKFGTWLLIGGTDNSLIDDLLSRPEVKRLVIVDSWGMRPKEMEIKKPSVDPVRKAQDTAYFKTIMRHQEQIKQGRLRVFRSFPQWVLRLLDDGFFHVVFIHSARKLSAMTQLLDLVGPKLKPGGLIMLNSYRVSDARGLQTVAAIHAFVGKAPGAWRIMGAQDSHIALESLDKTDD